MNRVVQGFGQMKLMKKSVLFKTIETPDGDTDTASIIENFLEQQSDRRWEQGYSFNEYAHFQFKYILSQLLHVL